MSRTVFYISDGTGLSAEALGHSLMTQFESLNFQSHTLPYIDTEKKAIEALAIVNESFAKDQEKPIIFLTIVKPNIRQIIKQSKGLVIDFFQAFIGTLEQELKLESSQSVGLSHAVKNVEQYNSRIEAVHFALQCDDGINMQSYKNADIILLGVSRTGKTPTCLYLALQFGLRAANFPLTEETLNKLLLPEALLMYRDRLFGLTISPKRLQHIRQKRRPNTQYASLQKCEEEVGLAEKLFQEEHITWMDSTQLSIEELSAHILRMTGLRR